MPIYIFLLNFPHRKEWRSDWERLAPGQMGGAPARRTLNLYYQQIRECILQNRTIGWGVRNLASTLHLILASQLTIS